MKKLLVLGLVVIGVGLGANPKVRSELARAWRNVGSWFECRNGCAGEETVSVPKDAQERKAQIKQVRQDIAQIEKEIRTQFRPVARLQREVKELRAKVKTAQGNYEERKKELTALALKIKAGTEPISVEEGGTPAGAKKRLASGFAYLKLLAEDLKSQGELLAAKQEELQHVRDGLTESIQKMKALEVRLAQSEAIEARLHRQQSAARPARLDQSRAARAANLLDAIRQSQTDEQTVQNLEAEYFPRPRDEADSNVPAVDPDEVLRFTQGTGTTGAPRVARKKKD